MPPFWATLYWLTGGVVVSGLVMLACCYFILTRVLPDARCVDATQQKHFKRLRCPLTAVPRAYVFGSLLSQADSSWVDSLDYMHYILGVRGIIARMKGWLNHPECARLYTPPSTGNLPTWKVEGRLSGYLVTAYWSMSLPPLRGIGMPEKV